MNIYKYLLRKDNYIILESKEYIIFNIKIEEKITVEFGIYNKYFKAKKKNIIYTKEEWNKLLNRLKNFKEQNTYEETYEFVDETLRYYFWNDEGIQYLNIIFKFSKLEDNYTISLSKKDTINLYKLIRKQEKS